MLIMKENLLKKEGIVVNKWTLTIVNNLAINVNNLEKDKK